MPVTWWGNYADLNGGAMNLVQMLQEYIDIRWEEIGEELRRSIEQATEDSKDSQIFDEQLT